MQSTTTYRTPTMSGPNRVRAATGQIMARKTKEQAQETRNLILDAAEQVFQERGVSHTSLSDIADAAGVTRGAIYWHFKNKVDLFNQMHERVHLPIQAIAEETASEDEPDPLGRLRDLLVLVLKDTVRNERQRRVLDVLFHRCEFISEMGALVERQTDYYLEALERTERSLNHAIERGQLPHTLDTRQAAVALNAYVRGLITNWLLVPDSFDLESGAESLIDAYFATLRENGPLSNQPAP